MENMDITASCMDSHGIELIEWFFVWNYMDANMEYAIYGWNILIYTIVYIIFYMTDI